MLPRINASAKNVAVALTRLPMWTLMQFFSWVVFVSYVFLTIQIRAVNSKELSGLKTEIDRMERDHLVLVEELRLRITALETTTYIDIMRELEKKKVSP